MLHYRHFLKIYFLFTNSSVIYIVLFKLAIEFLTSISKYFNYKIFGGSNLPHAFLVTFYVLNSFFYVFIISRNIVFPVPRSPLYALPSHNYSPSKENYCPDFCGNSFLVFLLLPHEFFMCF